MMKFWGRTLVVFLSLVMLYGFTSLVSLEGKLDAEGEMRQYDAVDTSGPMKLLMRLVSEKEAPTRLDPNETQPVGRALVKLYPSYLKDKKHGGHDVRDIPQMLFVAREERRIAEDRDKNVSIPTCKQGSECHRFQSLLNSWPDGKPKAAFTYLTKSDRLGFLKRSLESVDRYFNNQFWYPIIIFHESELRPSLAAVRRYTTSPLFFQEVEFAIPKFLTKPVRYDIPCTSRIGYRHMCRFHAKLVHEMPIIQGLDYYWRLDDDSRLFRPVLYDVFKFMQRNDFVYGYAWIHWDANECTTGLWEATQRYIDENNIRPTFFHEWPRPRLYYNNFEIAKLKIWLESGYERYVDYIDRLGGIYYHRWGDAPIKGLGLSLFIQRNRTHQFKDIGYEHAGFKNH